jgi:gliding motility-associated-like protein
MLIIISLTGQVALAQSSAIWGAGQFYWTSENSGQYDYKYNTWDISKQTYPNGYGGFICNNNGSPLACYSTVYLAEAATGSKIIGSDSLVPISKGFWCQRNDSVYDLIGFYDSMDYSNTSYIYMQYSWYGGQLFDTLVNYPSGYYRHTITKSQNGLVCKEKNKLILKAGEPIIGQLGDSYSQFSIGSLRRYSDYTYVFLSDVEQVGKHSLEIYLLENGELTLMDGLLVGSSATYFREPMLGNASKRKYSDLVFEYNGMEMNFSKTKIFFTASGRLELDTLGKEVLIARYLGLFEVDINPVTLKIVSSPRELWYHQENIIPTPYVNTKYYWEQLSGLEISSNDSILYFNHYAMMADSVGGQLLTTTNSKLMYWKFNQSEFNPETMRNYAENSAKALGSDYYLNPFGKMFFGSSDYSLQVILETNNPSGNNTEFTKVDATGAISALYYYDYARFKDTISYDCQAHVKMQNKSDQSAGMNSFTWYFTLEDGIIDTMVAFEPSIVYGKNGDYPYKCYGYSTSGNGGNGYGEYFIDTLKIRIPPKPVAKFIAKDTIVCAYSKATFTNQSTTDTVHATNGEKWVWTFGDGTSKTVLSPESKSPVSHSYKTPGTYTVSLFYSNGFCDSTLVKNQYINVVDAPAPGFTVDNIRGCSPFTVNVTDTVTKNTIRKEYNYYDGRGWIDVPVNQANFSQTYPDAGTYWITQRLYGYTGCVTQLDSVQIFVTPGFTAFDTSHITNATYQDIPAHPKAKEIVTLTWPCLEDAAVRYDIYRNAQKIESIVADSVTCVYGNLYYDDSLVNAKIPNTYTVLALDSCGTATQLGRVGQPVHLTGEVVGNNELSIIRYTAYQDWNVGAAELSYDLQTEAVLGDWKTLKQENSTADYRDYQFLDATKAGIQLEKCYRVITRLGGSKSTISNILCLPYSPVIFIPTAFSPNGDNLNDVYRPITFGITHYTMSIYDRYGQKVAELNQDSAGWDAADYPIGTYMITLRAKGTDSKWYNAKETVTVVR